MRGIWQPFWTRWAGVLIFNIIQYNYRIQDLCWSLQAVQIVGESDFLGALRAFVIGNAERLKEMIDSGSDHCLLIQLVHTTYTYLLPLPIFNVSVLSWTVCAVYHTDDR